MRALSSNSQEEYSPVHYSCSQIGCVRESFCLCSYKLSLQLSSKGEADLKYGVKEEKRKKEETSRVTNGHSNSTG